MADTDDFRTPGQLVQSLIDARGWTQRVLAIVLKQDETGINKIVAGKRPVTAELAIALGELFNVDAEKFLDLQKKYDLAQARIVTRPDPDRESRAMLFGDLPIAQMIKRGWIVADDIRDVEKVESELVRFFGVDSVNQIELLPHAAKKTNVSSQATPSQIAWLYRVRQIAREMLVAKYSPKSVEAALHRLSPLMVAPEESRHVPRVMAEAGIRFVIVESLPGAKIDGVCFWIDEKSPVVALTTRFDRIDNFWFVLRHEMEHVIQGHGRSAYMLDAELEGERAGSGPDVPDEERIANSAAADFCVPQRSLDRFIARKAPMFADRDILGFARTIGVHPGLVAGQIHNRTKRFDLFRKHLVKIRSHVSPGAIVDGWGDVAPIM